tara:strand:- start:260 stop:649 length:390 start_codon:yes stop_codon:yes gene_type:complete
MANAFDSLNDAEKTDDRYMDRVEFFLSLKKVASTRAIARNQTKELLKSKGTTTAKLRSSLGGRTQKAPNISKIHSESAKQVATTRRMPKSTDIKTPSAKASAPTTNAQTAKAESKDKLKKLLKAKAVKA